MADNTMNQRPDHKSGQNQTMQHEQAKASVSGQSAQTMGGQSSQPTGQGGMTEGREKSAIGGGENRSQSGDFDKKNDSEQNRAFEKSQSEPSSQR